MKGNKSKKMLILGLIIVASLLIFKGKVLAATTTTTENGQTIGWSFDINKETKQITDLKCTNPEGISGEIVIPSIIKVDGTDYTVVNLEYDAFRNAKSITKVTIPNTINNMKDYGYNGCFQGCSSLTEVNLGDISNINSYCFADCTSLKKITIGEGVKSISRFAFENCTSLESCSLPKISKIENGTFRNCNSLKSITIPNTVTTIGEEAFKNGKSLTEIVIPDSVTTIGNSAFENCINLKNVTISNSIQELSNAVFSNCKSLTEVVIPNSVVSIQSDKWSVDGAFYNCEALQKVTIPETVTFIGKYAFQNCGKGKLGLIVKQGSYSENWAKTNKVEYAYEDKNDDGTDLTAEVSYSPTEATTEQVTATIKTNKKVNKVEGWTISEDGKTLTKTYQKNTEETVTLVDEEGGKKEVKVEVSNITTKAPEGEKKDETNNAKKDGTEAPAKRLPQTGVNNTIFVVSGVVILAGVIGVIRYRKYKGI